MRAYMPVVDVVRLKAAFAMPFSVQLSTTGCASFPGLYNSRCDTGGKG